MRNVDEKIAMFRDVSAFGSAEVAQDACWRADVTKKGEKEPDFEEVREFAFTATRIEHLRRLVMDGEVGVDRWNRRQWRDTKCPGLVLVLSSAGAASFQIYRKVRGRPRRKTIGALANTTLEEAREIAAREKYDASVAGKIIGPKARPSADITVQRLFDAYVSAAESGRYQAASTRGPISKRTAQNYRDLYRARLKAHENRPIGWLAEEIAGIHKRMGEGDRAVPVQANRMLQLVRSMFAFAAQQGWWRSLNPCVDPNTGRSLPKYKERHRTRYLTAEEALRLKAALKTESTLWRDMFEFALLVGMRVGAVRRARWAEIDFTAGVWNIPQSNMKGGRTGHGVSLDDDALRLLRGRQATNTTASEFIFPAPRSGGRAPVVTYKNAWKRVRENAGLDSTDRAVRVRPHDLRRTYGTTAIAGGVDIHTVNSLLGNSAGSVAMTAKVYAHVTDDHARRSSEQVAKERRRAEARAREAQRLAKKASRKRQRRGHA
jgi:integrase